MVDEEEQSMTSASTTDYTVSTPSNKGSSSKQQNNTLNAIKTAVSFGSTTKDTSSGTKEGESGRQVKMSTSPQNRKLSMVSRMYDIDGDGQLGEYIIAIYL